ncbi:hypothetical protein [Singulisphaera sp. PoT]|uniref:hypothetical protein n=1 Tax=Singulisphaera sp. PoT TaxID=3411797 RepID=UPI003BF5B4B1
MKFTMALADFRAAFERVARFVPARTPMQVLQAVRIAVDGPSGLLLDRPGLELQATDNSLGIRLRVADVDVEELGVCLLPKEQLASVVAKADGDTIAFGMEGPSGPMLIKSGRARWSLNVEAELEKFPEQPEFRARSYHELTGEHFRTLVKRTIYAADQKAGTSYALDGLLFEGAPVSVSLVAMSGRSLASQEVPASFFGEGDFSDKDAPRRVIGARFAKEVASLVEPDDMIQIGFPDRSIVQVRINDSVISTNMLAGGFPLWRSMRSKAVKRLPVKVNSDWFRTTLEQASAFSSEESRGVDFEFSAGQLTCTQRAHRGVGESVLPVEWDHEDFSIRFDTTYIVEILKTLPKDSHPVLHFDTHDKPILIETDDGFFGLVSSLTREGAAK